MNIETTIYALISAGLETKKIDSYTMEHVLNELTEEEWDKIWEYSELHQIWSIIWNGVKVYSVSHVPDKLRRKFEEAERTVAYQYCNILSFTTYVVKLFEKAGIACYILKGIGLNVLYPSEDMRKVSDVDVYIPDYGQCKNADRLLRTKKFQLLEKDDAYHFEYIKVLGGITYRLEVHWRPCDVLPDARFDNKAMGIFRKLGYAPVYVEVAGVSIPVLPVEENAFELLLHMLQHFVHGGFGMRLICDWSIYCRSVKEEMDQKRFLKLLEFCGLTGFAWTVTRVAIEYAGLNMESVSWMRQIDGEVYGESYRLMYQDIIQSGEFAKGKKSQISIQKSGTSNYWFYIKEVHSMMCKRFPRQKQIIIIWPVLWLITISVFIYNNHRLDRGKTSDVISNQKKRHFLLRQMDVFNVKGSKK